MKIFYFGVWDTAPGHYMFTPEGREEWDAVTPWGRTPDGSLVPHSNPQCPALKQPDYCRCQRRVQGEAKLHRKSGWTAIGFVDYTGDSRPGSNSNFIAEGEFTFEEMVAMANEHFPSIMKRIGSVTQVGD